MADWNDPKLSQTWADRDTALRDKDESVAKMNYSGDTNIPEGAIRWNASQARFERYASGNWVVLTSTYNITVAQANSTGDASSLGGQSPSYYDDTPNGTRALFYQASAPTGWSQLTSVNDRVLRVVSGSGGSTGGSWTISGLNVLGHTLSVSEMPSHDHGMSSDGYHSHSGSTNTQSLSGSVEFNGMRPDISTDIFTDATGVFSKSEGAGATSSNSIERNRGDVNTDVLGFSGSHSHSLSINGNGSHNHNIYNTGGGNSHDHGISHNGNWRPAYADVIVCERSK